ncbi:phytoene desaturase family protein [Homoserinibacter sp. YIM 151385]|uniref:phytoene desaturase family protein n=1 Tax=Homoserinibacter sp. YIM 151385 TaxID=2985506 RepID=UPI0022F0DDCA|nr:NAD(P)/FAD-dependent oxidoreductase [Homoserinibacter sp. YIM 151385]WBU37167.1 NAD(P)/FAD-dependent oxidoreductase [Homoserinibacter sp. YIM 151385]
MSPSPRRPSRSRYDAVIVGGGHNGLGAAAYLAQAGRSVLVLERLGHTGGAAVSAEAFAGTGARLSRYSYLVSMLPERVIRDLGLDIRLVRRRYSSYTPVPGGEGGLLVDHGDPAATAESFWSVGAGADVAAWQQFGESTGRLARALFPSTTEPLATRSEARRLLGDDRIWEELVEQPIGATIERTFQSDLVRGVALTDALIGTFAPNVDDSLAASRCFMYHVIGGGTGDWDVPVGGMGAVSGALWRAAVDAGAEIVVDAEVTAIDPDGEVAVRLGDDDADDVRIGAGHVLANVAPAELARLLGEEPDPAAARPEGAQVKVNLLLSRLPRLREDVDPAAAFGGTFHINETWTQLGAAHDAASAGRIPNPLPAEIYCHSLSDPSILPPELAASGAQTLTVFGLHVPDRLALAAPDQDAFRLRLQREVLASLDSVLGEPVEPLLRKDAEGRLCIETKTTRDLEEALRMPGGNIFHGPLSWPFVEDDADLGTPARQWGVATAHERVLLCGSGARRGGAVSALGGHNAAMALLQAG